ncbi:MAG: pitrilysin family protein [archaeon]
MKFQKKVLSNGLTVLFEKRDVDVTTVMLGVRYGSGYDSVEEKGMAHFIEHLCFKGTEKRTAKQIIDELEKIGGVVNACTSNEWTSYFAKLPSKHLDVAMDVIFDIFFNATFPEEDVEKEASVICEEIKMYRDNPMRHTLEGLEENLFEAPFGISGTGNPEVVKAMTRKQLLKKHGEVYVPSNSILCVVGNNNFEEIISLVEKLSLDKKKGKACVIPKVVVQNINNKETRAGLEQANLAIGFHFPKANEDGNYAAELFSAILGHGMSSKLFTEVREKRGLVYGIKSDLDVGRNFGYLIIWAGTDPSKVDEVKGICLEEFHKMKDLTQEELDEAKIQVVGNWKVESEGSSETALNLFISEIEGNVEDYYNYEAKVNDVKLEDIRKLANKTEFAFFSLGP